MDFNLIEKVRSTRDARFNAYRRMKKNHIWSTIAVTVASTMIIVISLVSLEDGATSNTYTTIITVGMSIVVLVMSLFISLMKYEWKANNYHACGLDLSELLIKMECDEYFCRENYEKHRWKEKYEKHIDEYSLILRRYNLNHNPSDADFGMIKQVKGFRKIWIWIRWQLFSEHILYMCLSLASIIITGIFC